MGQLARSCLIHFFAVCIKQNWICSTFCLHEWWEFICDTLANCAEERRNTAPLQCAQRETLLATHFILASSAYAELRWRCFIVLVCHATNEMWPADVGRSTVRYGFTRRWNISRAAQDYCRSIHNFQHVTVTKIIDEQKCSCFTFQFRDDGHYLFLQIDVRLILYIFLIFVLF